MIDYFSMALTHALIAYAAWRLLSRDDLDVEPELAEPENAAEPTPSDPRPWLANQKYLDKTDG